MNQAHPSAAILADLIAFKTISGSTNLGMIEYLEHFARTLGFDTERIPDPQDQGLANLLCFAGPGVKGGIMLSGHTDVVPVCGQSWHSDPFVMVEKEGRLYGRGSTDMKGFIAATCHALTSIRLSQLKKPLSLLFTYDEEVGCLGSAVAGPLLKHSLPELPEVALIGEPTDFAILRMHSGHVTLKIIAKGRGAHSSNPALGISAIKAINQVLQGLFSLEQALQNELSLEEFFPRPYVTLNVGQIGGGSAVNIIPDEAWIILGFRPLPTTCIETLIDRISLIAESAAKSSGAYINVIKEKVTPAMITKPGTRLEKILLAHAEESSQVAAAYATDAGNLKLAGIDCLIFGPGSINIAHQANEYIEKKDLDRAAQKIKQIVEEYLIT